MIGTLSRTITLVVTLAVLAGLLVHIGTTLDGFAGWPDGNATERPDAKEIRQRGGTTADDVGSTVWDATRIPLAGIGASLIVLLVLRWPARRSRRYTRLWIVPYRADDADPEQVRRLLESWHQQVLQRWWRRLPLGQPSVALELLMVPDGEGDLEARLAVVVPKHLSGGFEGALLACYPDCRLVRSRGSLPTFRRVIRLKKRHAFVRALKSPEQRDGKLVDAVLRQMASLETTAIVQYTLTPTPALFDRYSRQRFSALEHRAERARATDRSDPGLRSEVLGQELEGGLRVQHRPLYFVDIRIAAGSYREAATLAGLVRGESGAENRLVERSMRFRGRLYRWRVQAAVGNPLPSWHRGVFSSDEIAGLWQVPSPGLKSVRITRSPVPRVPAPPEISRLDSHALARDERGFVGIRPEDKTDGLGLIGGQKTGKTSLLCRTVRADALDDECAVIVLMPKPGDAVKALSTIPRHRTVHYLDLEKPEFGINPLRAPGDPAMVADKVVEAFRDVNMEGDIRGSSDRYLRQAAQAAIGASQSGCVEGPPTLWHMYRMLLPAETRFRERVVEALYPDARFTDTATFFGRELPTDLREAASQTIAKLDAPRNKLLRLLVESLDKVLRHPIQLNLDTLVSRREILIVDGKMGTFGSDNCRVMMQFILNMLYGTLQRQQQLSESQRVRVALKVDEAHLILNDSFADALATLRSAGLEVVAAWQYGEQIQDPKIRGGMMSLLRQRCMFSMGESDDAREMSTLAMSVYTDMIRADHESRAQLRLTPDTILNLPNHHAVCSWISRGARVPAFLAKTMPLESDESVAEHHLEAQRRSGGRVPDRLPDPFPDLDWKGPRELPIGPVVNGDRPVEIDLTTFDPSATSLDDADERPAGRAGSSVPDSLAELDLDDIRGIIWDKTTPLPSDKQPEPTHRELEVLAALWSHRALFANQIWRRWWGADSLRTCQRALNKLTRAGWVRRFRFQVGERGAQQRVYCLTRLGFDLARARTGRHGAYINPDTTWREMQVRDPRRVLRDLHVNGWALALEQSAPRAFRKWRGPRESRLDPPRRRVRGEWLDLTPSDVALGSNLRLRDLGTDKFEGVSPDATIELRIPLGKSATSLDLLVELDRSRSAAATGDRLGRYDGLITGWSGMLDRYKTLGTPPLVVFVSEDEPSVLNLLRLADQAVVGRVAKAGTDEMEWPFPGRRAMFFAVEADVHRGSLQAFQLPEHPPELRVRLGGPKEKACRPRRVHIVEPRLLRRG